MALDSDPIFDAVQSLLGALGHFDSVNMHEPKNAPGNGLTASVWVDLVRPVAKASGLSKTSALLVFSARLQTNLQQEPQDGVDRNLVRASDAVLNAFTGGFTLGGAVDFVDLLGIHGQPLAGRAGYLQQDNSVYRVMNITIPLVKHDVWTQVS